MRHLPLHATFMRQVGYYAYSTYCATNFAVRGLAEALQMEVVNDNIRVSLMLPADTDTPGRAEDMKAMPEIAHKIMSTSGFLSADEVARKALRGIKAGAFVITITREGYIASLATAGLSPQSSFLTAFAEIMLAGFMRFVGLCFLYAWYNMIDKHRANKVKTENLSSSDREEGYQSLLLSSSLQTPGMSRGDIPSVKSLRRE